jgi:hypothetical protein
LAEFYQDSVTNDQKVFLIKTFYSSGSYVAVQREYYQAFSVHVTPTNDTIYKLIRKCEEGGNVSYKNANGHKHSIYITLDIHTEVEAITSSKRKSNQHLSQQMDVSNSTVRNLSWFIIVSILNSVESASIG